jgi:hypothetical protein
MSRFIKMWVRPDYMNLGHTGIYTYPGWQLLYAGAAGIPTETCRHICRYAGLTYLTYCAGTGEAGLSDLGSLVRHISPGYGQRLYPGYTVNLEVTSLQSRRETSRRGERSWWQSAQCRFTNRHCAKYCPLHHEGEVTVLEVRRTGTCCHIEGNQGESQVSVLSSQRCIAILLGDA